MKFLRFAIIGSLFLTACAEQFVSENAQQFNEKVSQRKDITAPEQIAEIYLKNENSEFDIKKVQINSERINATEYEVTIIQKLSDDSIAEEKTILTAQNDNLIWQIKKIRRNWKCHEDRGHTNWGTEKCV